MLDLLQALRRRRRCAAPGDTLPPLMFDADELDALALGLRLVVARAAENAMAKITAVLPADREAAMAGCGLLAGHSSGAAAAPS